MLVKARRTRRTRASLASSALVAGLLAVASPASAQPVDDATRSTARTLGEEGLALLARQQYGEALERFDKALALVQAPTLGVRAARCLEKLGRLVEASERYRLVGGMEIDPTAPPAFREAQVEAQAQAQAERDALLPRIPSIVIQVEGAEVSGVSLHIDGKPIPVSVVGLKRPIDPGAHHFEARWNERGAVEDRTLQEGESASVILRLPPEAPRKAPRPPAAPAPAPTPTRVAAYGDESTTQRTVGWIGVSVGGLGILAGVTTWILALDRRADLDDMCPDRTCDPTPGSTDTIDAYETFRTATVISLVAGGVALGGGITILLTAPSRTAPRVQAVEPWIGAGSAGIRGAF
jgi:hypothetical protein